MPHITTSLQLGQVIRERRKERGMSQRDLALQARCSQRFVSELERGKPTAELEKALDVLAALNLRVEVEPANRARSGRDAVAKLVERTEAQIMQEKQSRARLADYLEEA